MSNLTKYFIVSLALSIFTVSGFANSPLFTERNDIQSPQTEVRNIFSPDFKSNNTNSFVGTITKMTAADDASVLAGVWRMQYQSNICVTNMEQVFQPNGGYSVIAVCANGTLPVQGSGTWRLLQRGTIRVQYTRKSSNYFPDGQTITYQIIDRNRVKFFATVAYRAQ